MPCKYCDKQNELNRNCSVCGSECCIEHRFPKADGVICEMCNLTELKFKFNWNNKLTNPYFTTIRPYNEEKWKTGKLVRVRLVAQHEGKEVDKMNPFIAKIISGHKFLLKDIPLITSFLDTGYGIEATKTMMRKMYPEADRMWFGLYLIHNESKTEIEQTELNFLS